MYKGENVREVIEEKIDNEVWEERKGDRLRKWSVGLRMLL